jgi:5-methylcytosine-specific restriction endonuclease McrA
LTRFSNRSDCRRASLGEMPVKASASRNDARWRAIARKVADGGPIVALAGPEAASNPGCTVAPPEGVIAMDMSSELDRLGDEIAELSAHLEAATARLLDRIREFDARGGWNHGFCSCAAWLSWRVGLDPGAARERVRVARALGSLPRLAEALARGELSYAKVRAVTRVATPETEERLLAVARAGTAEHVERIVRGWRRVDRHAELRETNRQHALRAFHVYQEDDGTVTVRGRLTPEAGALLLRALDAARAALHTKPAPGEEAPTMMERQAGALADADQPGQSVLEDGVRVPAETSQRLACDASRVVMRHDAEGQLVEVGARTRTIPPALRRALQHRDGGCRFPGCGLRSAEGHHIRHWASGGPTTLSNLALLCRRHHRAVHEEGFQIEREADGALIFRRPSGRPIPDVPDPPELPGNPMDALSEANLLHGVSVDAHTLKAGWCGERVDVGWAIDVLHPLANPLTAARG